MKRKWGRVDYILRKPSPNIPGRPWQQNDFRHHQIGPGSKTTSIITPQALATCQLSSSPDRPGGWPTSTITRLALAAGKFPSSPDRPWQLADFHHHQTDPAASRLSISLDRHDLEPGREEESWKVEEHLAARPGWSLTEQRLAIPDEN